MTSITAEHYMHMLVDSAMAGGASKFLTTTPDFPAWAIPIYKGKAAVQSPLVLDVEGALKVGEIDRLMALVNAVQHRLSVLPRWKVLATGIVIGLLVSYCVADTMAERKRVKFTAVGLTGVQHIGSAYNVSEFYVDGYSGGNVGRGGGGGGTVCCLSLPVKWRPDLTVDVRWSVGDWSNENTEETTARNYSSIKSEGVYRARVPVEKYDAPHHFYVHFFKGGRVRVVASKYYPESKNHPIPDQDDSQGDSASIGTPVDEIFTKDELAEMKRKQLEREAKHRRW
jgi:hypothetical protein